jgi:hypothetical protein
MAMIEISTGTMEEKIIKAVQKEYPVTVADLCIHLHLSRHKLHFELVKLRVQGIIELEPLPDKTYVRLLRSDIRFVGRRHQETFIKRRRQKFRPPKDFSDDSMYR